jgi:hypothetical protein
MLQHDPLWPSPGRWRQWPELEAARGLFATPKLRDREISNVWGET